MTRSRGAMAMVILLVLATAGCAAMSRKFTFMRPDLSKQTVTRVAPEYEFSADSKQQKKSMAAMDRIMLSEQRLREGRLPEAEAEAQAAIKLDPKSADGYTLLAVIADRRGQAAEAGGLYARAAKLAPNRGAVLNNYGAWLCGQGRAGESLSWFDRALSDPAYTSPAAARANAGACALDAGQSARAERDLRTALDADPANPTALGAMARNAFAQGQYLEARAFSQRRLEAAPASVESLRLAAQIEQKLGDNQASARYLQQIAAQLPSGPAQSGETGNK